MAPYKRYKPNHKMIVRKLASVSKQNEDIIATSIKDVWRTIARSATDTTFMLCILLCAWFQYQHYNNKFVVSEKLRPLVSDKVHDWVIANLEKLAGLSVFAVAFIKMRNTNRNVIVAVIATAVYALPKLNQYDYTCAAALVFLYTECNKKNTRIVLIICSIVYIWYCYNITNGPITANVSSTNDQVGVRLKQHNGIPIKSSTVADTSRFAQKLLVETN